MKDMDHISVELAERIQKIMVERAYLKKRLFECECDLNIFLIDWAKEATGVHEGHDCYFKGRKVVLSRYDIVGLPEDFAEAPECIGALIRLKPETTEGPTIFKPDEISVKDFQHQEVDNNGGANDQR